MRRLLSLALISGLLISVPMPADAASKKQKRYVNFVLCSAYSDLLSQGLKASGDTEGSASLTETAAMFSYEALLAGAKIKKSANKVGEDINITQGLLEDEGKSMTDDQFAKFDAALSNHCLTAMPGGANEFVDFVAPGEKAGTQ